LTRFTAFLDACVLVPVSLTDTLLRIAAMNAHFPDALVQGWESLVTGIVLPDPDDRHVVAAALRGGADCILTHNLRDFPPAALAPLGLEAIGPDNFLLDQLDLAPAVIVQVVRAQAAATGKSPHPALTELQVLASLTAAGVGVRRRDAPPPVTARVPRGTCRKSLIIAVAVSVAVRETKKEPSKPGRPL
jgi:hypothetical protein